MVHTHSVSQSISHCLYTIGIFFTHTCTTAVDSDEAGSTKEAKACTKKAVVLFLEGFGY